jgi:Flp pilus assembly pilin Flp
MQDRRGQDITEYSLLIAFVVVIAVVIFLITGDDIRGIWRASSATVSAACSVAGS